MFFYMYDIIGKVKKEQYMKNKNIILKLEIILTIFVLGIQQVRAVNNPYNEYSSFGKNCTWYAWDQVYKRLGIALPGWHNAQDWYNDAQRSGYEVGQTPRPNSIAVWKWNNYGHVAFVEKVVGDKIYIWDSSVCYEPVYSNKEEFDQCILNGVSEETDKACRDKYVTMTPVACEYSATYWQVPGDLIGYIYLDKIPTSTYNAGSSSSNKGPSTTASKKSSNANLSSITISDVDFSFDMNTYEYNLEVNGDIENITVDAKAEDSKATVEGLKEYDLVVGDNVIQLVVSAEDGTKKTYTINIKRKDNNANLSSLTISGIEFLFKQDVLEYTLEASNTLNKIEVEATAESEYAKVDGLGQYLLEQEKTIIEVIVKAEDSTEKKYKITIEKKQEKDVINTEKEERKNLNSWLLIGGILLLASAISIIIIILKKRKSQK